MYPPEPHTPKEDCGMARARRAVRDQKSAARNEKNRLGLPGRSSTSAPDKGDVREPLRDFLLPSVCVRIARKRGEGEERGNAAHAAAGPARGTAENRPRSRDRAALPSERSTDHEQARAAKLELRFRQGVLKGKEHWTHTAAPAHRLRGFAVSVVRVARRSGSERHQRIARAVGCGKSLISTTHARGGLVMTNIKRHSFVPAFVSLARARRRGVTARCSP